MEVIKHDPIACGSEAKALISAMIFAPQQGLLILLSDLSGCQREMVWWAGGVLFTDLKRENQKFAAIHGTPWDVTVFFVVYFLVPVRLCELHTAVQVPLCTL